MDKVMQMSIFDFLKPDARDIDKLPENEMVSVISNATGIPFKWSDGSGEYQAKIGKCNYRVRYGNYNLPDDKARYISCGYSMQTGDMRGAGAPCNSLDGAIKFFNAALVRNAKGV